MTASRILILVLSVIVPWILTAWATADAVVIERERDLVTIDSPASAGTFRESIGAIARLGTKRPQTVTDLFSRTDL